MEQQTTQIELWQELTNALQDIYDPQEICAEVTRLVSARFKTPSLFGLKSTHSAYFYVWSHTGEGERQFKRFHMPQETLWEWSEFDSKQVIKKPAQVPEDEIELWEGVKECAVVVPIRINSVVTNAPEKMVLAIFDQPELKNWESVSLYQNLIATYIERACLRKDNIQQAVEYQVISNITNRLSSSLEVEAIFNEAVSQVQAIFRIESVSIGLLKDGFIEFVPDLLPEAVKGIMPTRISVDEGFAGWVVRHKQSVKSNVPYEDPRFFHEVDKASGFVTKNIMAAPMVLDGEIVGVLEVINKESGHFTEHDLDLLETIASAFAAAMRGAKLHQAVKDERERLGAILDSMSEGLVTMNERGEITAVNEALLDMLGKTEESLEGLYILDVIDTKNDVLEKLLNQLNEGVPYPQQTSLIFREEDSDVPVLISAAANWYADNAYEAVFTFSDITQVRELERMREDLFAGIVHEMRTPAATILLYARLINGINWEENPEKFKKYLKLVEDTSDDLQTNVRRMLTLVEMESADFARTVGPVDVNEILQKHLPFRITEAEEKGLTFTTEIDPKLPTIIGDTEMVELIFTNLFSNAVKYTQKGGIFVSVKRVNEHLVTIVKDDGIGIPEESIPFLFQQFYRTRNAVESQIAGTGIGLHMIKQAVDAHGGTIDVRSEEGKGSTFKVCLPLIPNL